MGVHYLIRNLEQKNGRLPFKLTFNCNDNFYLESDAYLESYKEIGTGHLRYIGIDGSVIIHSKINKMLNEKENAQEITSAILTYVRAILIFFDCFNNNNNNDKIILHFVIDGISPCKKNRRKVLDDSGNEIFVKDAYTIMSLEEKNKLHKKIIKYLNTGILAFNNKIELLTNYDLPENERGEGEIELFKVVQLLNKQNPLNKHVIVSSDSDLIALMLMHQHKNLIIKSPLAKNIFITDYNLVTRALELTTHYQVIKYVLLHFIFFGSDYNLGLMSHPNENKKLAILESVKNNEDYNTVNQIGQKCSRKRKRKDSHCEKFESFEVFLQKLKDLLIYEGICAFMYYFKVEKGGKYVLEYSPRLYEISETKQYISLLEF